MSKAIFLDRDGVINRERGDYTFKIEDFSFVNGIIEACQQWIKKGYKLIVITNQGGIAKGRYGHEDVKKLHEHITSEFYDQGVYLDGIYYCPHHDSIEKCFCRKPGPLMIERALKQYRLNPDKCVMIGDSERDIIAANRAGVKGFKINANELPKNIISLIDDLLHV